MGADLRSIALALVALLCLGCLSAGEAQARGGRAQQQARALFKRANIHFNLGEYDRALDLYRQAYTIKPLPGFLFNIGQCHFNQGRHDKALAAYQRYLMLDPTAPNRADVEVQIARCKAALAQQEPAGDDDDQALSSAESMPADTTGAAAPGKAAGLADPASAAASGSSAGQQTTGPTGAAVDTGRRSSEPSDGRGQSSSTRTGKAVLWTGVGLSAALLVTSLVTRGIALDMSSEYKLPSTPLDRQLELAETGKVLTTVSNVTLIVGAAAAAGTVLFYRFGYRTRQRVTVRAAALVGSGGGGLLLGGSF